MPIHSSSSSSSPHPSLVEPPLLPTSTTNFILPLPRPPQSPKLSQSRNAQNTPQPPPSRFLVFLTVSFYLVAALVMVFVNKWVLNSIAAPVFFLFCQLLIAVGLLKLCASFGWLVLPKVHLSAARALWRLVAINVLGLTFNTFCLQYVDASFYQVARGLVLPFTVLASALLLGTATSARVKLAIALVCAGFVIGVGAERLTVSPLGVLLGVASSVTTALHAIVVKQALSAVSSTLDLAFYSNLFSAIALLPPLLFAGELPVLLALDPPALKTLLAGTIVSGLFGFLICIAGFLSIKVTSPVTHMISSAVRGVIQTALGALIFNDAITTGRVAGIGTILAGSLYYTWLKDAELEKNRADPAGSSSEERFPMRSVSENKPLVVNIDGEASDDDDDQQDQSLDRINGRDFDDEEEFRKAEQALGFSSKK